MFSCGAVSGSFVCRIQEKPNLWNVCWCQEKYLCKSRTYVNWYLINTFLAYYSLSFPQHWSGFRKMSVLLSNRCLKLLNSCSWQHLAAKICDFCSQPLHSSFAVLLEAVLQRCNSAAHFVLVNDQLKNHLFWIHGWNWRCVQLPPSPPPKKKKLFNRCLGSIVYWYCSRHSFPFYLTFFAFLSLPRLHLNVGYSSYALTEGVAVSFEGIL